MQVGQILVDGGAVGVQVLHRDQFDHGTEGQENPGLLIRWATREAVKEQLVGALAKAALGVGLGQLGRRFDPVLN